MASFSKSRRGGRGRKALTWSSLAGAAVAGALIGSAIEPPVVPPIGGGDPVGEAASVTLAPTSVLGQSSYATPDTDWANPANALVNDATAATFTMPSNSTSSKMLKIGFTGSLPVDAKITGIELSIRLSSTNTTAINQAYLTFDGELCNLGAYTPAGSIQALETRVLGGPGYTFGTTLSAADLNAGRIGFALRCGRTGSTGTVSLQYVSMKVFYTTLEGRTSRGAAVATVSIPHDGTAIPSNRHRVAFPVGMGIPAAILFNTVGILNGDRADYLSADTTKASVTASFGMATPAMAVGGSTVLNNAGSGASQNATIHTANCNPSFGGTGGQANTDRVVIGGGGNTYARPVAFGDGYVDFVFSGNSSSPTILSVTAIYASGAHLYAADGFTKVPAEGPRTVNCGFEPNCFLTMCIPDAYLTAAHGAYGEVQFGGGKWDGTAWTNHVASWNASTVSDNGSGTPVPRANVRNGLALLDTASKLSNNTNDPGIGSAFPPFAAAVSDFYFMQRLIARSATGYTIETMLDRSPTEDNVTILALKIDVPFDFKWFDLPASTGVATIPTSFRPSAVVAALTSGTAMGLVRDRAETISFGVLHASETNAATHGWASPFGVNPLAATRVLALGGAKMINGAGAVSFAATIAAMKSSGVDLNVSATPGARKALGLFIG